ESDGDRNARAGTAAAAQLGDGAGVLSDELRHARLVEAGCIGIADGRQTAALPAAGAAAIAESVVRGLGGAALTDAQEGGAVVIDRHGLEFRKGTIDRI